MEPSNRSLLSRTLRRARRTTIGFAGASYLTVVTSAQGALPPPPVPPGNPVTAEKAVLGKILFWDEQLSSDGTMACGTCHQPRNGGADSRLGDVADHPGPDGILGTDDDISGSRGMHRTNAFGHYAPDSRFEFGVQATGRNSPSMIAAAYFPELFWDGRASDRFSDPVTGAVVLPSGGALESQSLAPILSDVEMAWEGESFDSVIARLERVTPLALATDHPSDVALALQGGADYPALFLAAFGSETITPVRIAFALATYQRTLVPDQSKFDRVMRGEDQFTQDENQGREVFRSNGARCDQCHSGSLFSDGEFHNLGIRPISEDRGRQDVTGRFRDRGEFKTPSLRNVALRDRFFHNGDRGIDSLFDVVVFYDTGAGDFPENQDPRVRNINIPNNRRDELVDFLETLTDPRVAAQTYPFDRPTLWSERGDPNPSTLGVGAVAGAGGFVPQITAVAPPKEGNLGFRVGLHGANGGSFGVLRVFLGSVPVGATADDQRDGLPGAIVVGGSGPGDGTATWIDEDATAPVLVGLSYDAQWQIRDFAASGGVACSDLVRITIE